jgi:hypothetical protein
MSKKTFMCMLVGWQGVIWKALWNSDEILLEFFRGNHRCRQMHTCVFPILKSKMACIVNKEEIGSISNGIFSQSNFKSLKLCHDCVMHLDVYSLYIK